MATATSNTDRWYRTPLVPPTELLLVICNRCEAVLLDTRRARRVHTNLHEALDNAVRTIEAA